jgi:hypothetical protein
MTMSTTAVRSRSGRRRRFLAAVAGVVVFGSGLAACAPTAPTPVPSVPPAAVADLPPLAPDGRIDEADLAHDSRSDLYRTPFGSVPAGTEVTLRIRATAGDLTEASIRVLDELEGISGLVPMEVVTSDRTAGEHGFDYWQATIRTNGKPTVLRYTFIVRDGPTTLYLEDDPPDDGAAVPEGSDGGAGRVYAESLDASWQITTYDPAFETPAWAHGAVVYQVFPDRFFDGDPTNNPTPDAEQGTEGAARFRYGDVYGNPILVKTWDELPEGHCRAYQGVPCDEGPLGRDFFGGDLAGVTAKLDDLAELGVTVIYFNPIFAAPSNHRYDTSSYAFVDPDLGTEADFERLVAEAEARGIRGSTASGDSRSRAPARRPTRRTGAGSRSVPRSRPSPRRAPPRRSAATTRTTSAGSASTRSPRSWSSARSTICSPAPTGSSVAGWRPGPRAGASTSWTT